MSLDFNDSLRAEVDHNRRVWDDMVRNRQRFTRPARDEEFRDPLKTVDGLGWLAGGVKGKRLLCLAAGGGRHGPLYAAAGAEVTVVDVSARMLELDRRVAVERGLNLRTIQASMDNLRMFGDREFQIVIHPVSTCYVPDIVAVYREVARVCQHEAIYISQHKQPASLQADVEPSPRGYELIEPYYCDAPLRQVADSRHREAGTLEYLHRWQQLVGGMCQAGFVVEDLLEPLHAERNACLGTFGHRSAYVAPYVRIKARRVIGAPVSSQMSAPNGSSAIWCQE